LVKFQYLLAGSALEVILLRDLLSFVTLSCSMHAPGACEPTGGRSSAA
jgi:hypothetical protein